MAVVTLTPLLAESGYIEALAGGYMGMFPNDITKAGDGATRPARTWRGFLSFDATTLPNDVIITAAQLAIPTVTTELGGAPETWETYVMAADLDLGALEASWHTDKGTIYVVDASPPTSYSVCFDSLVGVLFNALRTRIAFKLVLITPAAAANIQPVVATATLVLTYTPVTQEVSLTSGMISSVSPVSALGSASAGDSSYVETIDSDSAATGVSATSGMLGTLDLESGIDFEE